ncbi:hypothetical protein D4768_12650 [Rhodococcus erythropolis]|nr:hypothetical protein D4768_12650 [Rhodococcus erythropolis]
MTRSRITASIISGGLVATALLCSPAIASADHSEFTPLPLTYSLGRNNTLPCSGQLTGYVQTPHDRPGIAVVSVSWTSFFDSPCSITAYVNYSNRDTHTGGTRAIDLTHISDGSGSLRGESSRQISIEVGSGNAGLNLTSESLTSTLIDPGASTVRFVVA